MYFGFCITPMLICNAGGCAQGHRAMPVFNNNVLAVVPLLLLLLTLANDAGASANGDAGAGGACLPQPIETGRLCTLTDSALTGKHFRVRTVQFAPFYVAGAASSYNLDLLNELAKRGGFTYALGGGAGEDWGAAEAELLANEPVLC